jgi:tetratricopeptide (TPR) repeat protein
LKLDSNNPDLNYDLANAYLKLGNIDKAIVFYIKATFYDPKKKEYYYNLGNAYSL